VSYAFVKRGTEQLVTPDSRSSRAVLHVRCVSSVIGIPVCLSSLRQLVIALIDYACGNGLILHVGLCVFPTGRAFVAELVGQSRLKPYGIVAA
jgi:hypothetical protein